VNVCLCCGEGWTVTSAPDSHLSLIHSAPRLIYHGRNAAGQWAFDEIVGGSGVINPHLYMQVASDSPIHSVINNLHDTEPQQRP